MVRLREPVQNSEKRIQGFDSVRNPPFPQRFASRTLQLMNNPGLRTSNNQIREPFHRE